MKRMTRPLGGQIGALVITVFLLVAAVAACGDSDSSGSAGSSSRGETEESQSENKELRPLRIGSPGPFSIFIHTQTALEKGIFEDHGFDATIETLQAPNIAAALESGDIDSTMIIGSSVVAALNDLPVRVVGVSLDQFDYVVLASGDVEDISDLAGKRVASLPLTTTPGAALLSALEDNDLSTDDVEVVVVSDPFAVETYLETGQVDAALLSMDSMLRLAPTNPDLHTIYEPDEFLENPYVGIIVSESSIEEDANMVSDLLRAYLDASQYILDNRDETIQLIASSYDMSEEAAAEVYESLRPAVVTDGLLTEEMLEGQARLTSLALGRDVTADEVEQAFDLSLAERLE
jgi:ABC-type nitrate/sulfonate/bicarbonate transport system substrate-binding protein